MVEGFLSPGIHVCGGLSEPCRELETTIPLHILMILQVMLYFYLSH